MLVCGLAFCLSAIFAMGGVGSAIILVPVLHWLGYPLNEAKPTGLFVNTISLVGATVSNLRNGRLDYHMGVPIIVSSMIMAPVGAYVSVLVPRFAILVLFTLFLGFSGSMILFFKSSKYKDQYREDRPVLPLAGIGGLAGLISGLLGVGGGGVITPLMLMLGFNPKKLAAVTAFVIPFSSLTGFVAYWTMGHLDVWLVLPVGLAAYLGGTLGTHLMQTRFSPKTVKRVLGVVILAMAVKMALTVMG